MIRKLALLAVSALPLATTACRDETAGLLDASVADSGTALPDARVIDRLFLR